MNVQVINATCPRCGAPLEHLVAIGGVHQVRCTGGECGLSGAVAGSARAAAEDLWRVFVAGRRSFVTVDQAVMALLAGVILMTFSVPLVVQIAWSRASVVAITLGILAAPQVVPIINGVRRGLLEASGGKSLRAFVHTHRGGDPEPVDLGDLQMHAELLHDRLVRRNLPLRVRVAMDHLVHDVRRDVYWLIDRCVDPGECADALAVLVRASTRCLDLDGDVEHAPLCVVEDIGRDLDAARTELRRLTRLFNEGRLVVHRRPPRDERPIF